MQRMTERIRSKKIEKNRKKIINLSRQELPIFAHLIIFSSVLRCVGKSLVPESTNGKTTGIFVENKTLLYCPAVFGHFLDPPGNHPRGAIFPTVD